MEEVKFIGYVSHEFRDTEEPENEVEFSRLALTIDGYLAEDLRQRNPVGIQLYRAEFFYEETPFQQRELARLRQIAPARTGPVILTLTFSSKEEAQGGIFAYFQNIQEDYRYIRLINLNFSGVRDLYLMWRRECYLYYNVAKKILSSRYKSKIKHAQYVKSRNINLVTEPIGQGALSRLITREGVTMGLFDVGHGTPINKGVISNGKYKFNDKLDSTQVVFLSHWDEDHFQLATHVKFNFLLDCYWYFPFSIDIIEEGSIGKAFDYEPRLLVWETILKIVKNNKFMVIDHETEGKISLGVNKEVLYACGKKNENSNNRGVVYILSTQQTGYKMHVFIPGDADYQIKEAWLKVSYTSVIASHHGSKHLPSLKLTPARLPLPANKKAKFVFSFGFNDHHKHPSNTAISLAQNQGYVVDFTSDRYWQNVPNYKFFKLSLYNKFAKQIYHLD